MLKFDSEKKCVKKYKKQWQWLKKIDKRIWKIIPAFYAAMRKESMKHNIRDLEEWELPPYYDPKHPYPNTPYPEGALD